MYFGEEEQAGECIGEHEEGSFVRKELRKYKNDKHGRPEDGRRVEEEREIARPERYECEDKNNKGVKQQQQQN